MSNIKKSALVLGGSIASIYSMWNIFNTIPKVNAAGPCLVTIFGQQYDVAPLQTGHTGGNIFTCGTDMTSVYQGMHGTDVSRISAYLVSTPTPTPTPSPVVTPTPTPVVNPSPVISPTPTPTVTPTGTVTRKDSDQDEDHEDNDELEEREEEAEPTKVNHSSKEKESNSREEKIDSEDKD